jgi:hypothetical protein
LRVGLLGRLDRSANALPCWAGRVGELMLDGSTPGERLRPLDLRRAASYGREPVRELAGRWFVQSAQAASANCGSQARLPWLCSHGPEAFDLKGVQALTHSPTPEVRAEAPFGRNRSWIAAIPSPAPSRFAGGASAHARSGRRRAPARPARRPRRTGRRRRSLLSHSDPGIHGYTLPLQTRATRCRCADSAERAVGRSAPPAAPSKALSTFLGHACVTIPLDRYGHLSPGSEKAASGQRDRCLERSVGGGPA